MRKQLRKISGVCAAAVLAALGCGIASPAARADSAPDWLRAAAQDKLPEYPKETMAVTLLDDQETVVKENGNVETTYRLAYKLLRPEARDDYGRIRVPFDKETKLLSLKAWTITANGAVIEAKEKQAVQMSLSDDDLFDDAHVEALRLPEANRGSIVGYEYVQRKRPFLFEDAWEFQESAPTRRARFNLKIPADWEFTNAWVHYAAQQPQSSTAGEHVWELRDIPGVETEPDMPAWDALAGRMDIKYFPKDPKLRTRTTGSWQDIGRWYEGLSEPSATATPAIQQEVATLTAGMQAELPKMEALASYVQQKIRYVAIEIGIGGYRPHLAGDTFTHQYGDCKDKATLLKTMLHEIGIESFYVLIDTDRGVVAPDFPSTRFDHAILAIRLPASLPDTSLYAEINDPKLGRLLFFDPTDEYVPMGYLPSELQDSYGLVATADGGELLRLPLPPPVTNRLLRQAQFTLSASGDLSGKVQEVRWGGPAADMREEYLATPASQRQKLLDDFLGASVGNFSLVTATLDNLDQYDQHLALSYQFVSADYAKAAGDLLILRPRVLGEKGTDILELLSDKPRKYPVDFGETTRQDDMFDIKLPPGYIVDELPKPVSADCTYATYKSEIVVEGDTLHYRRTYEVKEISVPPQKMAELQAFFRQVAEDERSEAILRKTSH